MKNIGSSINSATLCIGLDIAWFGGSKHSKESQHDCLASALHHEGIAPSTLQLTRVPLLDRDPDASLIFLAVEELIRTHDGVGNVVFAMDAPIQAANRPLLPIRSPRLVKGCIKRRACDIKLSERRKNIDRVAGGSKGWHPNIQPGAPLAPRVEHLLTKLETLDFQCWTLSNRRAKRLAVECFPAEAIWAMKRFGRYSDGLSASKVKEYKKQKGARLADVQVHDLVHTVLDGFSSCSDHWPNFIDQSLEWMLKSKKFKDGEHYRGGKLLDDVVDSMICLATALSYTRGDAHVWQAQNEPSDGHIIGPGMPENDDDWASASPR